MVSLLLLAPDLETLALVYVVAAAQSSLAAFSQPAESALLPALVAPDDLVAANALNAVNNRIGRLAGLPLGSALFAAVDLRAVVLVDAVTFVVAAALMGLVRTPTPPAPGPTDPTAPGGPSASSGRPGCA